MHHLTLGELAQNQGMTEDETWETCQRLGVPVLHGRVDRSLFESALRDVGSRVDPGPVGEQPSVRL